MTDRPAVLVSMWGEPLGVLDSPRSKWVEADFRAWSAKVCERVEVSGLHPLKCWGVTGLTRAQWRSLLRMGSKADERVAAALEDDDAEALEGFTEFEVSCLRMFVEVMRVYGEVELLAGAVVREKMMDGSLAAVQAWRDHAVKEEALLDGAEGGAQQGAWGAPQAMAAVLGVFLPAAPQQQQQQQPQSPPPAPQQNAFPGSIEVEYREGG